MIFHFVGIGGIGMSGLARLALSRGDTVTGSDQANSPILDELRALGAAVYVGHTGQNVSPDAVVITTDAIKGANPEVDIARQRGQQVMRRSEMLGALMEGRDGIAVSGTHGKTSTTAMIARILVDADKDPTVVVGGEALGADRTARAGKGQWFVAEACEAYGSFLHLAPRIAVITNIEADHLDYHGDFDHVRAAFEEFAGRIREGGTLILNADDETAATLCADAGRRVVTYGLCNGEYRAVDVEYRNLGSTFRVERNGQTLADVHLNVPGEHNVSNALAAFAAAMETGIEPGVAAEALGRYTGVGRRFEYLGERGGVRVYDDYAHHPTEIRVTLAAAKAAFGERVIAVFQPHLYSRTLQFMKDFVEAFDDAGAVVITEIYRSREQPIPGVSGRGISDGLLKRSPGKPVTFVEDKADAPAAVRRWAQPGDVMLVMGAGDIRAAGTAFLTEPEE